jgi:polyisoprenoid-binding protein YceI
MKLPAIVASFAAVLLIGAVAAAAGWWFLVREDNELATSAPEIPADLVGGTSTPATNLLTPGAVATSGGDDPPASDVLAYHVIPERSEAAYFAGETLASVGLPSTAKGATTDIEGTFYLTADRLALAPGMTSTFTVQLANLTSDQNRRDNRVREALAVTTFPEATFTVASVSGYDPAIAEGEEQSLTLTGTLDLHGVQREVTWDVKAKRDGDVMTALATLSFLYADFDITPPSIGGFVSVEDDVTLQVMIVAQAR